MIPPRSSFSLNALGFIILAALITILFMALAGCASPTRATSTPAASASLPGPMIAGAGDAPIPTCPTLSGAPTGSPLHHNIPATFAGHPEGPLVYLCATQPRVYTDATGAHLEEDHYLQYAPCPETPID